MRPRGEFRLPWRTGAQIRADLDEELEFHIQMRAEELLSKGMRADEARREAEREFGDQAVTRDYCERMDRGSDRADRLREWFGSVMQDLRIAARGARSKPAYAIVVIATLALGVGANTAVFSVLDSVLLKRLPFPRADRLVTIDELNMRNGVARSDIAVAEYLDWAARQRSFTGIAMHAQSALTYADPSQPPTMLSGRRVSANFFDVLGVRAAMGRTFEPGEDRGLHRVVVLTNGAWTRLFGESKTIVGTPIVLGGDVYTVVGILAAGFIVPGMTPRDYFVPINLDAAMADAIRARRFHYMHGFGRLKDGVTVEAARAELTSIARGIERENPGVSDGHLTTVLPLLDATVGAVRPTILALMGAAGFVLLIATANLANLALGRALVRRREFAVRAALGASRARLARVALTESVSLALVGGALGAAIAWWGTPALLSLYPSAIPPSFEVHVNGSALVFALAAATLTGAVFGLAPVLMVRREHLSSSLSGSRASSAGRPHTRARNALVALQIALAIVLVVGAGLLVQTLARLQSLELGFSPTNLSFVWVNLAGPRYNEGKSITAFWTTVLSRLREEHGIESVALSSSLPLTGGSGSSLAIDGRPNRPPLPEVRYAVYSDGLVKTLGVAVTRGRDFNESDAADGMHTVLINEAAARKFWPGENPIGARVRLGPDPSAPWNDVVGVIGDYRQESLDVPAPPLMITNFRQDNWRGMLITVKSTAPPKALRDMIASAVHDVDRAQAVGAPTRLASFIDAEFGEQRFAMSVLAGFSALALLLAIVGVYGVIAYNVASRRQEFGVRVALGAFPRQLVVSVLVYGARLAAIGLAIGLIAATFLTRFLTSLLFQIRPLDAVTFVGASGVLAVATIVACWIPARRAGKVDPVVAMRVE
jgi:predicted permease